MNQIQSQAIAKIQEARAAGDEAAVEKFFAEYEAAKSHTTASPKKAECRDCGYILPIWGDGRCEGCY